MGIIVALDGLPGTGKTTAITGMIPILKERGLKVSVADIEQTGNAAQLRAIARTYPLGEPERILLFWVMKLEQYRAVCELSKTHDIVFADRFIGSAFAFDVCGHGIPNYIYGWLYRWVSQKPDLILFFDAPLEVVRSRKNAQTMLDDEFAQRVQHGYVALANLQKWTHIDATASPEKVRDECLKAIYQLL